MPRLRQFSFYLVAGLLQAALILVNDTVGGKVRPWHPSSMALVGLLGCGLQLVGAGVSLSYEKPAACAAVAGGALCLAWSFTRGFAFGFDAPEFVNIWIVPTVLPLAVALDGGVRLARRRSGRASRREKSGIQN